MKPKLTVELTKEELQEAARLYVEAHGDFKVKEVKIDNDKLGHFFCILECEPE